MNPAVDGSLEIDTVYSQHRLMSDLPAAGEIYATEHSQHPRAHHAEQTRRDTVPLQDRYYGVFCCRVPARSIAQACTYLRQLEIGQADEASMMFATVHTPGIDSL